MSKHESLALKTGSITYTVLWDRLNLYGLQSILILYLINTFGLLDKNSYTLYGTYTALSFTFTVLGGIIADRILGFYYAAIVGGLLIIFANLFLCVHTLTTTYIGLAFMVVGIGFLKPNNPNLLGTIHKGDSSERTRSFSIFYFGISLGSIVGPIIYGLSFAHGHSRWGFVLSTIGIATALLYLKKYKTDFNNTLTEKFSYTPTIAIATISILISMFFIYYNQAFSYFIIIAVLALLYFFARYASTISQDERFSLYSLVTPVISCIFFFTALLQIFSSVTLFIERYVDRNIFGWEIPTAWFSSLEPLCILFMVPLLTKLWSILEKNGLHISSQRKVIIGLWISVIAFIIFSIATKVPMAHHYFVLLLILCGNALLSAGELCTIPVAMSLINMTAPANSKGTLMGIFYFSLTFSGYLSGFITKLVPNMQARSDINIMHLFLLVAGMLCAVIFALWIFNNLIQKSMRDREKYINLPAN